MSGRIRNRVASISQNHIQLGRYESALTEIGLGGVETHDWERGFKSDYVYYTPSRPYSRVQVTWDQTHPWKKGGRDGGDFKSVSLDNILPNASVYAKGMYYNSNGRERYNGGFMPPPDEAFGLEVSIPIDPNSVYFEGNANSNLDLPDITAVGNQAWRKAKPKIEQANAAVFLGELRDAPRMFRDTDRFFHDLGNSARDLHRRANNFRYIWNYLGGNRSSKTLSPNGAANAFLNGQFGWAPFLNDLDSFHKAFMNSYDYCDRMARQNGNWVRRRVTVKNVDNESKISEWQDSGNPPSWSTWVFPTGFPTRFVSSPPYEALYERESHHVWATGEFAFYRPEFDKGENGFTQWQLAQQQLTMYGARITPHHLYQLVPWTWAADWVTNIGDYVSYLNDIAVDSLQSRFFYTMQKRTRERRFYQRIPTFSGNVELNFVRKIETKERKMGDGPYGLVPTWQDLSPRQLMIAAALGVTRVRG